MNILKINYYLCTYWANTVAEGLKYIFYYARYGFDSMGNQQYFFLRDYYIIGASQL